MIHIKIATTDDAAVIARLSRQTFVETFAEDNTAANMEKFLSESFSVSSLEAEVGAPGDLFFLAIENNQPVGYARLRENAPIAFPGSNAIEIARIYAVRNSIGKGIGKLLMQKCLATAKEQGKEFIWLGVWEKNGRAIRFYEKWGFEKFDTHIFVLGDDAQTDWLMKRRVDLQDQ